MGISLPVQLWEIRQLGGALTQGLGVEGSSFFRGNMVGVGQRRDGDEQDIS